MKNATVLGLGKMGRALAAALVAGGHPTTVWNRTPGRAADLPVTHAPTASAAVAAGDVVVLCLLDTASVEAVLDGVDLTGRTVVNLTTATPGAATALSALVTARGADYLDGGVMAVPSMIGTPAAVVLYSGPVAAFDRCEPLLSLFGQARHLGAEPGLAALHDIAMLTGMYGMMGGFAQAAAMVRAKGVPVVEFTETSLVPWLGALFPALVDMARQIDSGDYAAAESNLSMQVATDFAGVSRALGVSPELTEPVFALMRRRVAEGHGGDDFPSVIELLT